MFERAYNFDLVKKACNPERRDRFLTSSISPRIGDLKRAYSEDRAKGWMMSLLVLSIGVATMRMDEDATFQIEMVVDVFYERFENKRCSTWIVFLAMCLGREYKISYGSVKPDALLEAASLFLNALPGMEKLANEAIQRQTPVAVGEIRFYPDYDTYQYIALKGRLKSAWLSTKERYDEGGVKGILESLKNDDKYNSAIQIVLKRGLAKIVDKAMEFDEWLYEEQLSHLEGEMFEWPPKKDGENETDGGAIVKS